MRIFVNFVDDSGSRRTIRMGIEQCQTSTQLLRIIYSKLKIKKQFCIVKLKTQQIHIRILQGWYLKVYPLKNNSWLYVDILYQQMKKQTQALSPAKKLTQIEEQLELEFDEEYVRDIADPKLSFLSQKSEYDWSRYFQQSLQLFLSAVREQDLSKIATILKLQPQIKDESILPEMMKKKHQFLLNELGECGRAAIHWAIQSKNIDIVEFLLIKSCDPNIVSIDEYTPLQLAITLRSIPIVEALLLHPRIDINKVTNKGSALHVSVISDDIRYVKKVVEAGVDFEFLDSDKKSAFQVCKNQEIKKYLLEKPTKAKQIIPYIARGLVYRIGSITYRHKERLLLVNPFTNEFVLYEDKEEQFKTPLNKIKKVQEIVGKSWLMKSQYSYFQIEGNKKIMIGLKNKEMCEEWLNEINEGIKYCEEMQHKIKKVGTENQLIKSINDNEKKIQIHKRRKRQNTKSNISIFNIKPQKEEEEKNNDRKSYFIEEQKEYSNKLTSSHNENSQHDESYLTDLRDSEILGSVLGSSIVTQIPSRMSISEKDPVISFSDFKMIKLLGNGSFGKVFLAKHAKRCKFYALKVLNKKKLMVKKQLRYAVGEASILKKVDCPFIIKLHYSFQTPSNLYMALDYCPNGDLAELLSEKDMLDEKMARFYAAQLIIAIEYLHKKKIIYRDLKPENILIGPDGYIRLTDFGLSKENTFSMSFCGSPAYLSPEMLEKKGVGLETDIYGIGCVLFEMLVGQPPFFDDNIDQLFENIKNAKIKYPSYVSKVSRNLINGLLERNMKKRLGVGDINKIKKHEFFNGFDWKKLQNLEMGSPEDIISSIEQDVLLQSPKKVNFMDSDYDNPSNMMNRIKGFTFARQINQ